MKPVKFRCKRSGNVVSFTNEGDIAGLRNHEGYEEVVDPPAVPIEQPTEEPKKVKGRPRKGS